MWKGDGDAGVCGSLGLGLGLGLMLDEGCVGEGGAGGEGTGGGSLSCERCGRRYALRSSLKRHQMLECGVVPQFPCPMCVYRATRRSSLAR
ncbi:Longitudinals lacking protein, isoforms A/B/D/L, partial [Gryllus bimaculatus]